MMKLFRKPLSSTLIALSASTSSLILSNIVSTPSLVVANNSSTAATFISVNAQGKLSSTSISSSTPGSISTRTMAITRDIEYPGTAVDRLKSVHERVKQLVTDNSLINQEWEDIRRKILWAGGLRDLPNARPGQGYTGHSFNDFNHVDLTCMLESIADNENDGSVKGIALGNRLGEGIRVASIPELGPGGSWSTCAMGCHHSPPKDVAHIQFQSRIAFKLVWVPNTNYDSFVLVDDDGKLLASGKPSTLNGVPALRERQMNYKLVQGSKYATVADRLAIEERINSTVASE